MTPEEIWKIVVANVFLLDCGRAPENPIPPRWERCCRRWATKHVIAG